MSARPFPAGSPPSLMLVTKVICSTRRPNWPAPAGEFFGYRSGQRQNRSELRRTVQEPRPRSCARFNGGDSLRSDILPVLNWALGCVYPLSRRLAARAPNAGLWHAALLQLEQLGSCGLLDQLSAGLRHLPVLSGMSPFKRESCRRGGFVTA